MDKSREVKIIAVVALLVAVVGLSVAYAALSTTLKITGTATVNSASWDVHFIKGTGTPVGAATFVEPTISDDSTALNNYSVKLTKPGDSVTYTFKITNAGSINAKLGTVNIANALECTSTDTSATGTTEAATTCSNLTYSVTYSDDSEIKVGDVLNAGETKDAKITITFNSDADTVPASIVTVSGLDVTLIYNQA